MGIKISDRGLYTLFSIVLVLSIVVSVNAYANPATGVGHDLADIGFPSCTAGQILEWSGSAWSCGTDDTGTSGDNCATSGTCSQVCIGTDCQTSWPETTITETITNTVTVVGEVKTVYVDGSSKMWGMGRPGVDIVGSWQDMGNGVKAAPGNIQTHWGDSQSGCPSESWVCKQSEIDTSQLSQGNYGVNYWLADRAASTTGIILNIYSLIFSSSAITSAYSPFCCAEGIAPPSDSDGDGYDSISAGGTDCNDNSDFIYPSSQYSYHGSDISKMNVDCIDSYNSFWSTVYPSTEFIINVGSSSPNIIANCGTLPESGCNGNYGQYLGSLTPSSCNSLWDMSDSSAYECAWSGGSCIVTGIPYTQSSPSPEMYYAWCN